MGSYECLQGSPSGGSFWREFRLTMIVLKRFSKKKKKKIGGAQIKLFFSVIDSHKEL